MCCITSPVTDRDPNQVILLKERWQNAVNDVTSPSTLEGQKLPQNQCGFIRSLMDAACRDRLELAKKPEKKSS
jgi:hypothetical protein